MENPNPTIQSDFFYELLHDLAERAMPLGGKVMELNNLYTTFLKEMTRREIQFFPNDFTRSEFIIDNFKTSDEVTKSMKYLQFIFSKKRKEKGGYTENEFSQMVGHFCRILALIANTAPPDSLQPFVREAINLVISKPKIHESLTDLHFFVLSVGEMKQTREGKNYFILEGSSEEYGSLTIYLWEEFSYLQNLVWVYSNIYFSHLRIDREFEDGGGIMATTKETLVALDPDFLVDVTNIKECLFRNNPAPLYYIADRYSTTISNDKMFRGTLVNSYLDEFISGNDTTAAEVFDKAIQTRPFSAFLFDDTSKRALILEVESHFRNLVNGPLNQVRENEITLEPTFVTENYGMRGRLDLLVDYKVQDRKDVIELKTSKDPRSYGLGDVWGNDALQAICYNLMVKALNQGDAGSSSILYSSVSPTQQPLRNVPNTTNARRFALGIRNQIVAFERLMIEDPEQILSFVRMDKFPASAMFDSQKEKVVAFESALKNATALEKAYFLTFSSFVASEFRSAKIGSEIEKGNNGFASFWRLSRIEKENQYSILAFLNFENLELDNSRPVVKLNFTPESTIPVSTFRKGDFILLYPHDEEGNLNPTAYQLLKATIRDITDSHVVLNIFNQNINESYFANHPFWALEPELFEYSFECMRQSLLDFLKAPQPTKNKLLGLNAPRFSDSPQITVDCLKPKQNEILNKALAAQDYFLIQGPPGTGKTKYMVKEITTQLLKNPAEKILLLAYTNRAVDEICEAIKSIQPPPLFFRMGYSETTEHEDILLSGSIEGKPLSEIRNTISNSRIVISTVLTFQRNPELSKYLNFTIAIVDEASQLLEPQIAGILTKVKRFILIGDEKQLPAVVTQSDQGIYTRYPALNEIGIKNLTISFFERLLRRCQKMGWNEAFGRLIDQGRMHTQIQKFPSEAYYDGDLRPISPHQEVPLPSYLLNGHDSKLRKLISDRRLIFIPSKPENLRNRNVLEAKIAAAFALKFKEWIGDDFDEESVGIITPYRAQIAEIKKWMHPDLREKVTVDTVERYQGGQRKVIIYSFAVNKVFQLRNLHVLDEEGKVDRRLNVALTRAKEHLVLLGCAEILGRSKYFAELLNHISAEGKVLHIKMEEPVPVNS